MWILLLGILLGQALVGPQIELPARGLALIASLLLVASSRPRWVWPCLGLALGVGMGGELSGRVSAARRWDGYSGLARITLLEDLDDGWAPVWICAPGMPAQRAYVSRLGKEPRPAGSRGVVELRSWLPPARRNPDDLDRRRSSLQRGFLLRGRVEGTVAWELSVPPMTGEFRARVRSELRRRLHGELGDGSELWMALLLGDRQGLPKAAQERFRRLGLAHLLALSGLHVGLLAALLLKLMRSSRHGTRALWALPPLVLWAWMAGMGPSLFRAVVVLSWLVVGRRAQREHRAVDGLAVAGVLELLFRPESLTGLAWWLSYAATLALLRAVELPLERRWQTALLVVIVAPLATSPWVLSAFGRMPYAGPLWNLIIAPPFAIFMAFGVFVVLTSLCLPPLASLLLPLLAVMNHAFGWVLRGLDQIDPGAMGHPAMHGLPWGLCLSAIAMILVPGMPGGWRWRVGLALALLGGVHLPSFEKTQASWWTLDVGQGDGGVLRVGRSRWLVVDAGNGPYDGGEERVILPYLRRRNAREVELMISHGHRDHYGGALSLLRSGLVGTLHLAKAEQGQSWTLPLLAVAEERSVRVSWLSRGDAWNWEAWRFECLWPPVEAEELGQNDRSLVLRCGPPGAKLLITGDLEAEAEALMLEYGDSLRTRVLKVAHHGSRTGTGIRMLERLGGGWALISCGIGNGYGHPHSQTLEQLEGSGWELLRTDQRGAVGVVWTRTGLQARCIRPPP